MNGIGETNFEIAVLIGVALVIVMVMVVVARRHQPTPTVAVPTSSALPPDLAAMQTEMTAMKGRMSDLEHGVNQVRTMLNALPTKDSVHRIEIEVAELKGDLKVNNIQTIATAKGVERIENWLMEEAKTAAEAKKKAETEKAETR